jgi:zinc transport system permease protein
MRGADMLFTLLQYQFIQNAIIASMLASIVCGIIGVIIIEKKLVMMSGGIAHTSFGGVGLGYFLGIEPVLGALFVSVSASLGICYIKRRGRTRSDVLIGLFWSLGMALGTIFIALTPGYPPDLASYLFGSILTVTRADIYLMALIAFVIAIIVISLFEYWKSFIFDQEFAAITGIRTVFLEYLLFIMIAISVVALIRVVGIILVMALFTAPTAIAGMFLKSLKSRMIISTIIGCFFCLIGLFVSYAINIPSGAAIVVISVICYLLFYVVNSIIGLVKRKKFSVS